VEAHLDVVAVLVLIGGHLAADEGPRLVDVNLVALPAARKGCTPESSCDTMLSESSYPTALPVDALPDTPPQRQGWRPGEVPPT
jgi:hypothetical protein